MVVFRIPSLRRLAGWPLDAVFPRLCPGCHRELTPTRWLCGGCRRRLGPPPGEAICLPCRTRLPGRSRKEGLGAHCPRHGPAGGVTGFWMGDPIDSLIHALKYGGRPDLGRPLGRCLARRVAVPRGTLLTPLPLHRVRHRERGYNQAERLAAGAAEVWGTPVVTGILQRPRAGRAQADQPRDRRAGNVAGAFVVSDPGVVRGRIWAVVDDVMTSGSTLAEAAGALRAAGASQVLVVAVALA